MMVELRGRPSKTTTTTASSGTTSSDDVQLATESINYRSSWCSIQQNYFDSWKSELIIRKYRLRHYGAKAI